jgi:hypothetical protein
LHDPTIRDRIEEREKAEHESQISHAKRRPRITARAASIASPQRTR